MPRWPFTLDSQHTLTSNVALTSLEQSLGIYSTETQKESLTVATGGEGGRKRSPPPLEEFVLTMVRLRLGLFEQDLAYRFGVSQSTVS